MLDQCVKNVKTKLMIAMVEMTAKPNMESVVLEENYSWSTIARLHILLIGIWDNFLLLFILLGEHDFSSFEYLIALFSMGLVFLNTLLWSTLAIDLSRIKKVLSRKSISYHYFGILIRLLSALFLILNVLLDSKNNFFLVSACLFLVVGILVETGLRKIWDKPI